MDLNNKQAHKKMDLFHSLCDSYNKHEIETYSPALLKATQVMAIECLDLIKFLFSKEDNEATRAYMIFCGRILIRISYLRSYGRIESQIELAKHVGIYSRYSYEK